MSKKKSFVLYCDQYEPVKNLTIEQKGLLLDSIFLYNCDKSHEIKDPTVEMAFLFFKQTFDRDCIKYSARCKKNKENAMKRWHANASDCNQVDAKHADSGNGTERTITPELNIND